MASLKEEVVSSVYNENLSARLHKKTWKSKKGSNKSENDTEDDSNTLQSKLNGLAKDLPNSLTVVVRVLAHTQINKVKLDNKRAHISEITVNGGSVSDRLSFAGSLINQTVPISQVFNEQELITIAGVTKGKGFNGVVKRFGVTIQPRKSNKGIRKVACIGAWHPAGVLRTVARAGQLGCFSRVLTNKKVVKIGNGQESIKTDFDLTEKTINPMGGFNNYGLVKNDFIMVKGPVMGPSKRVITLSKSFTATKKEKNLENIDIKFIDTSSKMGHGRFQTSGEKTAYFSK